MIKIKSVTEEHIEVLALLGRITYKESHGQFIHDQVDLQKYSDETFSISKTREDLKDSNNLFFIAYVDGFPVGYAKLILNEKHEIVGSINTCRLDKIYILEDFLDLKIGHVLLTFLEDKVRELRLDSIWLATYIKNYRAIRFYEKNDYSSVGKIDFLVNGTAYENIVFSKKI